jgi:hypothetical protein
MDDDIEYVPHPAAKKIAAKVPCPRPRPAIQVKAERSAKPMPIAAPVKAKAKAKHLNGNNVQMSNLPEFAQTKWRTTFLPTLYGKFFTSDQLFNGFYKDSDQFVTLFQSIIQEVYPDIDYNVTSSDSIHFLVRSNFMLCFSFTLTLMKLNLSFFNKLGI